MTIKTLYPTIKPTLDLNFARSKTVDPRITFGRASTATYYDGKTVAKAEENLLPYSQQFDNWGKQYASVSQNSGVAPDGTSTAAHIVPDAAALPHGVIQNIKVVAGQSYTLSVYAKAGAYDRLIVTDNWHGVYTALFSLSSGTVVSAAGCTGSIISVGNGWYRCVIQFTPATYTDNTPAFVIAPSTAGGYIFTADGVSGGYLWGAQLEQRNQVTAYTPTTTQPITNYVPVLQTAPANVPRIDHDPVTGECKGLLIEEQRTNLVTNSAMSTGWGFSGNTTYNAAVAPDGVSMAVKIAPNAAINSISQGCTTVQGQTYTLSFYAKYAGARYFGISPAGPYGWQTFDLVNGTRSTLASGFASASIVYVGSGWYRCIVTYVATGANNYPYASVWKTAYSVTDGNGFDGIYIWGAQLETGSFPTSYIPTTTAQVTRAADSASMTGANFSSWYRQDEGTLCAEVNVPFSASYTTRLFAVDDGTSNNVLQGQYNSSAQMTFALDVGGANKFALNKSGNTFGTPHKFIGSYKSGDAAFGVDGSGVSLSNSSWAGFVPTTLRIGMAFGGGQQPNGHIKRLTYYPKRLTNAQLQALTA